MVDIEQHALRAFEQDARTGLAHGVEALPHRLRKLQHVGRDILQLCQQRRAIDRRLAETGAQRIVMGAQAI